MPINYEGEVLYSTEELSRILSIEDLHRNISVPEEEIRQFIVEKGFDNKKVNGDWYLERDALGDFFNQFSSSLGVSYKYHQVPEYLKNCTSPWAVTLVKMYQERFTWPAALPPAQGEFLRNLVLNTDPKTVLEIGCFIGVSTIWMASALEQLGSRATIHSVDLFNEIMPGQHTHYRYLRDPLEYAQSAAASAQLSDHIKFYKMDSKEMGMKAHEILDKPIDLLFIDGDHTIDGCLSDFMLFYPHVSVGGYIVLHDIYPETCGWDGPRFVIDNFIKGSLDFELVEIETTASSYDVHGKYGMALIRKLGLRSASKQQHWAIASRARRNFSMALVNKLGRELGVIRKPPTMGVRQSWQHLSYISKLAKDQKPLQP